MQKQRLLTFTFIISLIVCSSTFAQIPDEVKSGLTFRDTIKSIVSVVDNNGNKTDYVNTIQMTNLESVNRSLAWSGYLSLDGDDDYAQADDHTELDVGDESSEDLTVEAWVNFSDFSSSDVVKKKNAYVLYTRLSYSQGTTFKGLGFMVNPIGMLSSSTTQWGAGGFWDSGWHHVAGVYNQTSGELMLYMDGKLLHSYITGGGSAANSEEPLQVGLDVTGQVDEVRISNVMRYADTTYSVPESPYDVDENTRALWHFDEVEGATEFHDVCMEDNLLTGYNGAQIITSVVERNDNFATPGSFYLHQSYPNPFNPTTQIRFAVPTAGMVNIDVFNMAGQKVETLVNDRYSAGVYEVQFRAKNLASGLYFYRLTAGNFTNLQKMMLLK